MLPPFWTSGELTHRTHLTHTRRPRAVLRRPVLEILTPYPSPNLRTRARGQRAVYARLTVEN